MSDKPELPATKPADKRRHFFGHERLNLTLAICAICISTASFYATYLQAQAAEKQVKAMTMPFMQFTHGNWEEDSQQAVIQLSLSNAGLGPARIDRFTLVYEGEPLAYPQDWFDTCCQQQDKTFIDWQREVVQAGGQSMPILSSQITGTLIKGQQEFRFLHIPHTKGYEAFWNELNDARWKLDIDVCYCSLLDECYHLEAGNKIAQPVEACS